MQKIRFIRALGVRDTHLYTKRRYQLEPNSLGVPDSIFEQPMTLIPLSEINVWLNALEQHTNNPDIILDSTQSINPNQFGSLSRWMMSSVDLASTIRRVNYGLNVLQSGAFLSGSQSGNIIKWTYHNPFIEPHCKVHDGVRLAVFLTKVLREYVGDSFSPMRIMLPGIRQNREKYTQFFGCDVEWNHTNTEVWFHSDLRLTTRLTKTQDQRRLSLNFADLDDLFNMPEPEDEIKTIYEIVNYSCHYGLPTVERASSLLGMSNQQFQRRLHSLGMSFTQVSAYVLSNAAVALMAKAVPIEEIARRLGYHSLASFNRMFKKQRGVTPQQFLQRFYVP
ncbi:AraC family transcriptional regulator [Vibrio sinensis]|uniref:AraC family transcriptional regulator n=1 Tax=Vibrio sinensis TaxID=2302434 RepID=A0A3A6R363_9VIBR|nr:AraC family transcriptional regulator [Vibrio sinensis]RJX75339.1 AraC family transcriptional regulator [Vibrio sinensis]